MLICWMLLKRIVPRIKNRLASEQSQAGFSSNRYQKCVSDDFCSRFAMLNGILIGQVCATELTARKTVSFN